MMGFEICENFRLPYFAKNPRDFWQRWHISLSTWLRDYLYIPLGGNRKGSFSTYRNLFIIMLLGGLWHGASWKYVVWGAYHGSLLIIHRLFFFNSKKEVTPKPENRFYSWFKVIIFFHLTCAGWFIFRTISIKQLVQFPFAIVSNFSWIPSCLSLLVRLLIGSLPLFAFQVYQHVKRDMEPRVKWSTGARIVFYVIIFYLFIFFKAPGVNEFIYFRF